MQSRVRQFVDLPPELRLMVWKYALRPLDPARPGAHFFSVANIREDGIEAARFSSQCRGSSHRHCCRYHLAAPKLDSSKGLHSWTEKNPSAYVWDFGLWSACRESRQVIEAHYRTEGWTLKLRGGRSMHQTYSQTSVSLRLSEIYEKRHFFFHPEQDLVCLQAFNPTTIRWRGDYNKNICIPNNAPKLLNAFSHVYDLGLFNFRHVAIAYDPSWNDITEKMDEYSFRRLYEEQSARGFFIRTLAVIDDYASRHRDYHRGKAFWLIDYNLKRVRYLNKNKKGRKVFYGNGQTFTEVDRSLSRRSFSAGAHSSAFDFVDNLDILLEGDNPGHFIHHINGENSCHVCRYPPYRATPYRIHHRVRVLMCEEST